jgi:hypothetical protein
MNTHRIRLTLLGLALCLLLALLIVPQTRWLVRAQLLPSTLLPGRYEQQKRLFVRQHPNDYQIQLAGQADGDHRTQVEYARSLVPRFPANASLRANILRYATYKEVHLYRDETVLLEGMPVTVSSVDPNDPPPTPANLAAFDADAAAGERLDPDNAYFPFMRAVGLFAAHRDAEGLAAVQRASAKHVWREYVEDEVEGHWRINDGVYGGREAIASVAVSAATEFPDYQGFRTAARVVTYKAILEEQVGHPEAGLVLRRSVVRCGELMGGQSNYLIGNLLGVALSSIAEVRPGGGPPPKPNPHLSNNQRTQERLDTYCAYVNKIGHPEAATEARTGCQTWQQVHRIGDNFNDYYLGGRIADCAYLVIALVAGQIIAANILSLFVLGLAAVGVSRLPQIQARRLLPAGATVGFWSAVGLCLLLVVLLINADPNSFNAYAAILILTPLIITGVLALFLRRLRRSIATGLLAVMLTLGIIALFGTLAAWQMQEAGEVVATFRQLFPSSEDITEQMQALLGSAFALALPLLCAIILSIVSRVKRVPVSVGLVTGFRNAMPALVCALMLVYGGLVLWTVRQEARANYGLERSLHGEGQYLAQRIGAQWPQSPRSLQSGAVAP